MPKGSILFVALFPIFLGCSTRTTVHPPSFSSPSIESIHYLDEYLSGIPVDEKNVEKVEKEEIKEEKVDLKKEKIEIREEKVEIREEKVEIREEKREEEKIKEVEVSHLTPVSIPTEPKKEPLSLPDIIVSNLFLKQKRHLVATLTNIGTAPFPMEHGSLNLFVDGQLEKTYALKSLSDRVLLQPNESIALPTPFMLFGKHEVEVRLDTPVELKEMDKENNQLKKILEGLPIGPDIVIRDFDLTEDMELSIILSNAGEGDLRKGVIFRVQIYLNDRKVSDFEHFISEELKAHSKNLYTIEPPYRVSLKGGSKVRVSITPKVRPDDIRLENNILERKFIIFPFRIGAQGREQFSFFIPFFSLKDEKISGKIKVEVRWDGADTPLKISFEESDNVRGFPDVSGKSPLKIELPFTEGEIRQERLWKVSVTNPVESRVEGHLIIQHP